MLTVTVGDLGTLTDGGKIESVEGVNGTINQLDVADTHGTLHTATGEQHGLFKGVLTAQARCCPARQDSINIRGLEIYKVCSLTTAG